MARNRTQRVEEVKARLVARAQDGIYQPGDRFLSAREVADRFSISYQTAHRLIQELCREGHLQRVPASGTFLPGGATTLVGAQLLFHERGRPAGSFGQHLSSLLQSRLERDGVALRMSWNAAPADVLADHLPVIWEQPQLLAHCASQRRSSLLLNDLPTPGFEAMYVDSVSTDDYAGGVCAGQLLQQTTHRQRGFVVLAGPAEDRRSQQRVEGFCSLLSARVVIAGGWSLEHGLAVAEQVVSERCPGVFCCNDSLASAVIRYCETARVTCPTLVGFDDAPIAEPLNLTTIALPWQELVSAAAATIKRRLAGDRSAACRQIYVPRPVIRSLRPRGRVDGG